VAATKKTTSTPAPEAKTQIVTEMTYDKSTKGTYVFTDSKSDTPITTLYIKRHGFQGEPPSSITVTVEASA
jgi:hypothetical protein